MPVKRLRIFAGPNGSGKSELYKFLIQLFIISLIIRKFFGVTGKSKFRENLIFIIINIINVTIFTFYMLSLSEIFLSESYLYIRFSSRIPARKRTRP